MTQYEPGYREQQATYGGERYGEWGPGFEGRERFGGAYSREGRFEGGYGAGGWGHTDMGPGGGYGYGGYSGYTGEAGGRFGGGYNPGGAAYGGGFPAGQAQFGAGYAPSGFTGTSYGNRYGAGYAPGRHEFGTGEFERREWAPPAYGPEPRGWAGDRPWAYENRRFEGGPRERFGSFEPGRWAPQGNTQFGERRYGPY